MADHLRRFQQGPILGNPFASDPLLQAFLRWRLPADLQETLARGLLAFGQRVLDEVHELGLQAEAHLPKHIAFDPWGARIDQIEVSGAWKRLQDIAAREGLVSIGYDRAEGPFSRLHQFSRLYLFHPDSACFTSPLAMTDGAARTVELYGDERLKERVLPHFLSRDPAEFWTAGRWVTERSGGSDLGGMGTVAVRNSGGQGGDYRLQGAKSFVSDIGSPAALALARIEGAPLGGAGLSLFYVEPYDEEGRLRNLRITRLRDKLGSRALPMAELELEGTPAFLMGDRSHGIRKLSASFNLTRIHHAVYAVSSMRRALALAKDYAGRRLASGRPLSEHPLHVRTLSALQVEWEGCFHLAFHLACLLGRQETGAAAEGEEALLRLLTPAAKLFTGKRAVSSVAEALEAFGGAGYLEDTGIPVLLRDAMAFPIAEGATDVLALDVLRAMERDGAFEPYVEDVHARLRKVRDEPLAEGVKRVRKAIETLQEARRKMDESEPAYSEAVARGFAFGLARTYIGSLLLEFASWLAHHGAVNRGASPKAAAAAADPAHSRSAAVAMRWCRQPLVSLPDADAAYREMSSAILAE